MGDSLLRFLCQYLDATAAAFYASDGSSYLRVATYGVPNDALPPVHITSGDGLLGQARTPTGP